MSSEHHDTKPASSEELRAENVRLREQLDAARDALVPLRTGLDQLTTAVQKVAADWLRELLFMPTSRPGFHEAQHINGLEHELRGILEALTGSRGDGDDVTWRGDAR
jgi:hypothetical protein